MAGNSVSPCVVWFRDDLRLSDHPALHAASRTGAPVICLYILDEMNSFPNARAAGAAARWWLAQSLRALQEELTSIGSSLLLRRDPAARDYMDAALTPVIDDEFDSLEMFTASDSAKSAVSSMRGTSRQGAKLVVFGR